MLNRKECFMLLFCQPFLAAALMDYTTDWICFTASSHPPQSLFLTVLKLLLHAFVLKTRVLITLNITPDRRREGSITFCHGSFINSSPRFPPLPLLVGPVKSDVSRSHSAFSGSQSRTHGQAFSATSVRS